MDTCLVKNKLEFEGFSSLYYLLIEADGVVTDNEVTMGKLMCKHENFDQVEFQIAMQKYKAMSKKDVYEYCVNALCSCSYASKVRSIAWMTNIANCDGFMSTEEWKLIFKIYKKELNVKQQDIIITQKVLPKI